MNKPAHRRSNRGDEKPVGATIGSKTKSQDRKVTRRSGEHVKKPATSSTVKNNKDNEVAHHPKRVNDDGQRKSKTRERGSNEFRTTKQLTHGDGDTIRDHGKIHKYVFHDDDSVALKMLQYNLEVSESLLTLFDPKKPSNKRTYYILSAKDVYYEHIKDSEAFQLKVKKTDKDMVSDLVLKGKSVSEKYLWLDEFGIKISLAYDLLKTCIEEVENRRFCKGQKKRNEVKELKEVDIGTLLRALDNQKSHKLKLSNDKRWNVSRIEKLIQVLLSEVPQPLVPYTLQEVLEKSTSKNYQREYARILKKLPVDNHKMLEILIEHLENLTNYYTNQLNATSSETEKIRRNICARLTPLIIRQEFNRDTDTGNSGADNDIVEKFCNMFYKLMETTDVKKQN